VESCEIFGNTYSGVAIKQESNPTVRNCKIHSGKQGGLFVYEEGRGTIEGCRIYSHANAGVEIKQGGDPVILNCHINRNGYEGVWVHEEGRGTLEGCDLTGNTRGPWDVAPGCRVRRRGNRE
jgi:parallel beta-helix repeat protein